MVNINQNETDRLIQAVRGAGLRLTPQRTAICTLLAESSEHPSAQSVYQQLLPTYPSLSLTTVYNTLETLVGLGAIIEVGYMQPDGMRYEPHIQPHINLACTNCKEVIDLPNRFAEQLHAEVSRQSGYQIQGGNLLFYGICPHCAETEEN